MTSATTTDAARVTVRRSRIGVTILFLGLGICSGGFASRLPAVKSDLHLSAGTLGLVLLGPAFGLVLSTPLTGFVLQRIAPRRWILVGLVPFCAMLPLAAMAHNPWLFFAALLGWGFGSGTVDVSMNTEATRVQAQAGRRIMSTFHGTFSIGALVGAGVGALSALGGIAPKMQWTGVAIVSFVAGVYALTLLPKTVVAHHSAGEDRAENDRRAAQAGAGTGITLSWPLVALAVICFVSLLSEGAASDWSAVYMHTSLGTSPAVATIAYAGFTSTMVLGRLTGDRLSTRFGPVNVVRTAAILGALGLGTGLIVANPVLAVVGFTLLGIGLSASFPLAITTASGLGQAGPSVAIVTSCGYLGMLSGPAVIGGLASLIGLPTALGLLVALCVLLAVLAGTIGHRFAPQRLALSASEPVASLEASDR